MSEQEKNQQNQQDWVDFVGLSLGGYELETRFGWKLGVCEDEGLGPGRKYSIPEESVQLEIYPLRKTIRLSNPEISSVTTLVSRFNITDEGVTFQRKKTETQPEFNVFIGSHGEIAILKDALHQLSGSREPLRNSPQTFPPRGAQAKPE